LHQHDIGSAAAQRKTAGWHEAKEAKDNDDDTADTAATALAGGSCAQRVWAIMV